jgi:hypothetical protein
MQFSRQQSMIDYVEWGAGGQAREETAVRANLWTAGGFVPAPSMGQLLRRTGAGQGAPNWSIPGGN